MASTKTTIKPEFPNTNYNYFKKFAFSLMNFPNFFDKIIIL